MSNHRMFELLPIRGINAPTTIHRWQDARGLEREVRTQHFRKRHEAAKFWRDSKGRHRYVVPEQQSVERCHAWARSRGRPCRAPAMANGRCRLHGGLSTGPKTAEGRARALANLRQYRPTPGLESAAVVACAVYFGRARLG